TMRSIIAIIIMLAVCASAVQVHERVQTLGKGPSPAEFGDFMVGFCEGMEIAMNGNVSTCVAESDAAWEDFANGFHLIGKGFDHLSARDFTKGMELVGNGLAEIPPVFDECGITQFLADIISVSKELSSGAEGVIEVVVKETLNIFHHGDDISEDWKNMVKEWKKENYNQSGVSLGLLVGIIM
ncbi:hypothetical protein SAMD00019534_044070, partial [Acytostelium subglobosum LB1]|uniref:hypothetical protein n=1 Tax=Acytostelium subglobosum LB1 TaxID=1410327 RepID=UPI000644EDCD